MPHAHGGPGAGEILRIRCTCGHDLERHLGTAPCDVGACPCLGFEAGWDEENEEIVRA